MASPASPWIWAPGTAPGGPIRLFCVPYAGAGASVFFPWTKTLKPAVDLWAARLPGREGRYREPAPTSITEIAEALWNAIHDAPPSPRLILYGHSMGAVVAFELARRLRDRGPQIPDLIMVSGRAAPNLAGNPQDWLHPLPDARFLELLEARYQGLPRQIRDDSELLRIFLPVLRADLRSVELYQHAAAQPLPCPLTVLHGLDDASTSLAQAAAWRAHSTGPFRLEAMPGGHFFPFQNPGATLKALWRDAAEHCGLSCH